MPGIESAYIYGSWARRYAGEPGGQPQDIDVTVLTAAEWAAEGSGFVSYMRSSPLVPLDLGPDDRPGGGM